MTEAPAAQLPYVEMATEILPAYVANNRVALPDMPRLIRSVQDALSGLDAPAPAEATSEPLKPAVPTKRRVTEEFIISLEDGRKLKSMKRYLTGLGVTPADYRAKWGHPMVAPGYAKAQSELAPTRRSSGGRRP